ncbi:hypothetical protein [Methylogaea oryzae]|uniref:hypothetical protein n=1 Tax=Methylogaea oryzae TaxID=1295382 RepID=UPI0006CF4E70|nr:hypothetical protein [Methylogaea oryzae]
MNGLIRTLRQQGDAADEDAVRAVLNDLLQSKLIAEVSGKFLGLAVRRSDNVLVGLSDFPERIAPEALEQAEPLGDSSV